MKKLLLSFVLVTLALINVNAQLECNQNYTTTLDPDGEAEILVSDLVPNIEFMLTQGTVSYFVFPFTSGTITSADDVISLTCQNRGLPGYIVEVTAGGALVENCTGTLVITSPNGGCPGDNPAECGDDPDCLKILSGFFIGDDFDLDVFAIDFALCEDALGCGSYSIAYGSIYDSPTLDFTNSISSADATEYKNPVAIKYTDSDTTAFVQSYLYVWSNQECILTTGYKTFYELDLTAETQITPDNLLTGDIECESVALALTGLNDPEPINYESSITVNCDNLGQRKVWIRNTETGFTLPRIVQILDPLEACGTVLGPGDRLVTYTKSLEGLFFNSDIVVNDKILPRHPGGIGFILNEADLVEGENTLNFLTSGFPLNGMTTLDIVLGQRIILLDEYDHPRESVLFDIDMSGYNGIGDLITMREIILGISNGEDVPVAYFFNNSYEFPADFDPFDFENTFTEFSFDKADFETVDLSFEAYKTGDLNDSAIPGLVGKDLDNSITRSSDPEFQVTDMEVVVGQEFDFELKYESEEKFKGLLTALVGDGIVFKSLNINELNADNPRVDFNIINENEIRILYGNPNSMAELKDITFTISAEANKAGVLVELLGLKSGFPQEVIGENNTVSIVDDLSVITTSVTITGLDVEVKVYPNPAHNKITLSTKDSDLQKVSVFDVIGREVLTSNLKGNVESLEISDLATGLYHMVITTDQGVQAATFVKE